MASRRSWRPRGRPALGAVFGLLFGLFLTADLLLAGVFPLHATAVVLLPVGALAFGLLFGWWAPLPRRRRSSGHEDDLMIFGQRRTSELRTLADDEPSI